MAKKKTESLKEIETSFIINNIVKIIDICLSTNDEDEGFKYPSQIKDGLKALELLGKQKGLFNSAKENIDKTVKSLKVRFIKSDEHKRNNNS